MQAMFMAKPIMNQKVRLVIKLQVKPFSEHPIQKIIGFALIDPDVTKIDFDRELHGIVGTG